MPILLLSEAGSCHEENSPATFCPVPSTPEKIDLRARFFLGLKLKILVDESGRGGA
jgi:hypothetical protein